VEFSPCYLCWLHHCSLLIRLRCTLPIRPVPTLPTVNFSHWRRPWIRWISNKLVANSLATDSGTTETHTHTYCNSNCSLTVFTTRSYSQRGIAEACCPTVRLSVCDVEVSWSYTCRLEFLENNFTADKPNHFSLFKPPYLRNGAR